jgi:hypothetical protein
MLSIRGSSPRIAAFAVVVMCAVAANSVASAEHASGVAVFRCPPPHSHVFRSDRTAVVYEGLNSEKLYEVLGCVREGRRAYTLGSVLEGSEAGSAGVSKEVLAGPMVAYEQSNNSETAYSPGYSRNVVFVRDLRSGRILHRLPTGTAARPGNVGRGPAFALVVKSDGAVAWINPIEAPISFEVHAVDRSGIRVLASGTGISPESLRLKGSTLSWVQDGKTAFAKLD